MGVEREGTNFLGYLLPWIITHKHHISFIISENHFPFIPRAKLSFDLEHFLQLTYKLIISFQCSQVNSTTNCYSLHLHLLKHHKKILFHWKLTVKTHWNIQTSKENQHVVLHSSAFTLVRVLEEGVQLCLPCVSFWDASGTTCFCSFEDFDTSKFWILSASETTAEMGPLTLLDVMLGHDISRRAVALELFVRSIPNNRQPIEASIRFPFSTWSDIRPLLGLDDKELL